MSEYTDQPRDDWPTGQERSATHTSAPTPSRRSSRQVIGPFTLRDLVVTNLIIAAVLVALPALTQPLGASGPIGQPNPQATFFVIGPQTQGLTIGQAAPELAGTADNDVAVGLTDLEGRALSLAALKGHPVWINFWATWCPPCQHETPDLRDAYNAHKADGLVLIGVDVQEEANVVRDYVGRYQLVYPIGMDVTGAIFRTYRVFGLPTHYFIDRNGIIRDRVFGPLTREQMEQKIAAIEGR